MGNTAVEAAKDLTAGGAAAVGLNCGNLDPLEMAELVLLFRDNTRLPIVVQPNAGRPRLVDNRSVFDLDPSGFAEGMVRCVRNGADIIGGCCGTTPEHIRAAKQLIGPSGDQPDAGVAF